jgi:ComF family protein
MNTHQLSRRILDLLFPPRCQCCEEFSSDLICAECRETITRIEPPFCETCGRPFDSAAQAARTCGDCRLAHFRFDLARAVGTHTEALRRAIIAFKFHGRTRLRDPLAGMLTEYLRSPHTDLDPDAVDVVVPVPLHDARLRWRGYNQSALLAGAVGGAIGKPVRCDLLVRQRETEPQIDLTPAQRRDNVRGAFAAPRSFAVRDRRVLLIDDVFTTGATLSECARVLKRAGATRVIALTLSRSRPDWDAQRDLF